MNTNKDNKPAWPENPDNKDFPSVLLVALEDTFNGVAKFEYIDGPPVLLGKKVFGKLGFEVREGALVRVPYVTRHCKIGGTRPALAWEDVFE